MRKRYLAALPLAAASVALCAATAASAAPRPVYFDPSAPQTATSANCAHPGFASETGTYGHTSCGKAGYVASGRDFRYAQALVTVPDHNATSNDPALYVRLDGSKANNDFATVGVGPFGCGTSGWCAYVDIQEPGFVFTPVQLPLATAAEGAGVFVSVYLTPNDAAIHAVVRQPSGNVINGSYPVPGSPVYTDAQAFADYTNAAGVSEPAPAPAATVKTRDSQFEQGRFTTVSGATGTFKGPWSLTAVDATSNGSLPPSGTLIGQPSYLWTSAQSYHGLFGDSFGVWRFPF